MNINDVYLKTLQKVNKNLNSNNISLDKLRFVMLYNEEQVRRVLHILEHEKNDINRREIQFLLKRNISLVKSTTSFSDRVAFKLPNDYLDISSAHGLATKNACKDKKIFLWEIKDDDYTEKLSDEYNKPSFEFRESPFIVADNHVDVFTENFDITETFISYYKYPKFIDIEGYLKSDNSMSTSIDPEGGSRFIDKVTSMVAKSYAANTENINKFQIEQTRIQNNI